MKQCDFKEVESIIGLLSGFKDHTKETGNEEPQNSIIEESSSVKSLSNGIKEKLQHNHSIQSTKDEST